VGDMSARPNFSVCSAAPQRATCCGVKMIGIADEAHPTTIAALAFCSSRRRFERIVKTIAVSTYFCYANDRARNTTLRVRGRWQ